MKNMRKIFLMQAALLLATAVFAQFPNPLMIPDTLAGPVFNLTVAPDSTQFLPGTKTLTYGINQSYLGPTLIWRKGDHITLNVTNNLGENTTMHWHGAHVAPEDDGGPHTIIADGATWSPDFDVLDEATTFWYHPHLHHFTAQHVYHGAAGMILLRDENSDTLSLPHTYGVDEFPLIIQDKSFDSLTNQLIFEEMSDTMMVNGTLGAHLEVPAQMVRFHVLNASNQRVYNLAFPPQTQPMMIASDGGFLEAPLPAGRIQIAPGERVEMVLDFGGLATMSLPAMANNSEMGQGVSGGPNGPGGGPGNPLDGVNFAFMEFRVVPPTANPVTSISQNLNTITPWDENDADVYRTKLMDQDTSGFPYYINSTPFSMSVINDTVWLDDTEVWTIENISDVAHPFHIHDIQFFVLDVNGNQPPAHLRGRKDVIMVPPNVAIRFIAKFDDFASDTVPYMYHCHNLFHEDAGMMGQFIVRDPATGGPTPVEVLQGITAYPNPTSGRLTLSLTDDKAKPLASIFVTDLQGRRQEVSLPSAVRDYQLDLSGFAPGVYLLEVRDIEGRTGIRRIVKN